MSANPISHLLAMNKCALAIHQQLAEAGSANFGELTVQWPASQARLAQLMKSGIAMGEEWRSQQAAAFSQLLKTQLAASKPTQTFSMLELMELHDSLMQDLAEQRRTALKEAGERLDACVDDLRKAQGSEEVALVAYCFVEDMGKKLRANAEQTATLLTSATAAAGIAAGTALDSMIDAVQVQ